MSNHVKLKRAVIRYPLSVIRYPLSVIRYPLSVIRYPLNNGRNLLLFPLFILILIFSACGGGGSSSDSSSDPKVIAAEWRETLSKASKYYADATDSLHNNLTVTIGEHTITLSGGDLGSDVTISNVYTQGGGPVTLKTPGEWTYVYKDGVKIGYIIKYKDGSFYCCGLYIGDLANTTVVDNGTYLGISIDLTSAPSYPSLYAFDNI